MTEKLKVFEAFAGIGSQARALEKLGIPHEVVGLSEWDRYSMRGYDAVHKVDNFVDYADTVDMDDIEKFLLERNISSFGVEPLTIEEIGRLKDSEKKDIYNIMKNHNNYASVVNIDPKTLPDMDLFTYSFPCQDISNNGYQKGLSKGSGTRSGLLWECEKIIKEKKPKYLMMENVKALLSKKFLGDWELWVKNLEDEGYTTHYQVLRADEYGSAQKRERVIGISILNEDPENPFTFPKARKDKILIKDMMQTEVPDSFFLSQEYVDNFVFNSKRKLADLNTAMFDTTDLYDYLLLSKHAKKTAENNPQIRPLEHYKKYDGKTFRSTRVVYSTYGLSPTLTTMQGGGTIPAYLVEYDSEPSVPHAKITKEGEPDKYIAIRNMTPLESWELMGFDREDFNRAQASGLSNSKLYKQAGDSIVVNVLEAVFKQLLVDNKEK